MSMNNTNYKHLYSALTKGSNMLGESFGKSLKAANDVLDSNQMNYGFIESVSQESVLAGLSSLYEKEDLKKISEASSSLKDAYDTFKQVLSGNATRESFGSIKNNLTQAQIDVALQAYMANSDSVQNNIEAGRSLKDGVRTPGVEWVSAESVSSNFKFDKNSILSTIARENFDGANGVVNTTYAMVLSSVTARPADMVSLFFPSIVVKHDEHKYRMIIDVANFVNSFDRDRDSTREDIRKKAQSLPILKNLFNPDIMEKDITRVMPYAKDGANVNSLVPGYKWISKHTYESFETGYIKAGIELDLIGASQSDVDLKKTPADNTDALLPTLKMESMLVKVKTKSNQTGVDFKFILEDIAGSVFTTKQQGDVRDMVLNMTEQVVSVKLGSTLNASGAVCDLGTVCNRPAFAGYVLKFGFELVGSANLPSATVKVDAVGRGAFLTLKSVHDANGVEIPLSASSIADLVAEFTDSEFLGYTVIAYRANTNFKKTGQFIELKAFGIEFAVNFKNPVSILGSINNFTGDTLLDWSLMNKTITAVTAACNYNGLTAIFKHAAKLKERTLIPHDTNDQIDYNMCNHVVDPYYNEFAIDFSEIDSLKSSDRFEDIQAAVIAKITKLGMDMYLNSNYAIAFEEYYRDQNKKPTLLLGTDILTASYLTKGWTSNKISLNNILDLVVVTDIQPRMREVRNDKQVAGIGFLTFTLQDSIGEMTKPDLLHFGFQCVSPVINVVIDNKPHNGGLVRQAFVLPRYDFYPMLPIMTVVRFTGYEESIDKIAMNTTIIAPKVKAAASLAGSSLSIDGSGIKVVSDATAVAAAKASADSED